jgi:hypothetical protein
MMAAFEKAYGEAGQDVAVATAEPTKPKRIVERRGGQARRDASKAAREDTVEMTWSQDLFGTLATSVAEGTLGGVKQTGSIMYAPVSLEGKPSQLTVQMDLSNMPSTAIAYHVTNGNDCAVIGENIADLVIPITWVDNKPSFGGEDARRVQDVDNCDVIIVTDNGLVVQMQISVSLRYGKLKLQVQEVAAEQLVHTIAGTLPLTSHVISGDNVLTAVPLWAHQAHPQKDWLNMANVKDFFPTVMLEEIIASGRSTPLYMASWPFWDMPGLLSHADGTMDGVVLWYNAIWSGGGGFMLGADGKSYKIHWSQIKDAHVVQPGEVYRFTPGKHKGRPQASKIQAA